MPSLLTLYRKQRQIQSLSDSEKADVLKTLVNLGSYDSQKFSLNKGKITRDNVDSLIEKMESFTEKLDTLITSIDSSNENLQAMTENVQTMNGNVKILAEQMKSSIEAIKAVLEK